MGRPSERKRAEWFAEVAKWRVLSHREYESFKERGWLKPSPELEALHSKLMTTNTWPEIQDAAHAFYNQADKEIRYANTNA